MAGRTTAPSLATASVGLPELNLVTQHQHDPIALADAELFQPGCNPVGPLGHRGKANALLAAVLLDNAQRGAVIASGNDVEPIGGPVEGTAELRPGERMGERLIGGQREDLVTRGAITLGVARHGS